MVTLTIQPPIADAPVYSWVADSNYGTRVFGDVGAPTSGIGQSKTVIKFDLSTIPSYADIKSAILSLYYYTKDASATFATNLSVRRLTQSFNESTVTWNNFPSDEGSNIGSTTVTQATSYGFVDVELTPSKITELINGTMTNNGFLIHNDNADQSGNRISFYLREWTTESDRPKLIVEYVMGGGEPVAVSPFFNFFKSFENPWLKKGNLWQPQISEGI